MKNDRYLCGHFDCNVVYCDAVEMTGDGCFASCLLVDRNHGFQYPTHNKKLKTIINRFLFAFCPLRVQLPTIKSKNKCAQGTLIFLVEMTGVEPVSENKFTSISTGVGND